MSSLGRVTGFTGHPVGETKTNLCVGMDKGKPLTKRELKPKQVSKKGRIQKRVKFVRDIVREVVGFAPYEKRCMELLKVGKEKRALKVRTAPPQPRLPLLHFRRLHVASQPLAPGAVPSAGSPPPLVALVPPQPPQSRRCPPRCAVTLFPSEAARQSLSPPPPPPPAELEPPLPLRGRKTNALARRHCFAHASYLPAPLPTAPVPRFPTHPRTTYDAPKAGVTTQPGPACCHVPWSFRSTHACLICFRLTAPIGLSLIRSPPACAGLQGQAGVAQAGEGEA